MAAERGSTIPPVRTRSGMRTVTPIWFESDRQKGADAAARSMRDRAEACRRRDYLGALISSGAPAGTGYLSTTNSIVSMWKWPMVPTVSTTPRSPNWSTMAL
jgi:hypothetical protein